MTFAFPCPHCQRRLRAPIEGIGKSARCDRCRHRVIVPEPPTEQLADMPEYSVSLPAGEVEEREGAWASLYLGAVGLALLFVPIALTSNLALLLPTYGLLMGLGVGGAGVAVAYAGLRAGQGGTSLARAGRLTNGVLLLIHVGSALALLVALFLPAKPAPGGLPAGLGDLFGPLLQMKQELDKLK